MVFCGSQLQDGSSDYADFMGFGGMTQAMRFLQTPQVIYYAASIELYNLKYGHYQHQWGLEIQNLRCYQILHFKQTPGNSFEKF